LNRLVPAIESVYVNSGVGWYAMNDYHFLDDNSAHDRESDGSAGFHWAPYYDLALAA
jgi:hypothetical protein